MLARLMYEVEVFTRFAGLGKKLEPVDVIQAWATKVAMGRCDHAGCM